MASPTDNQVVSRVREAAKRILGAGKPNRKEPLSTDILKDIVEGADLSNILHLRNVCLYVLARDHQGERVNPPYRPSN